MRIVCLIEGEGVTTQDEVVHTFRAAGWEEAFRRAIDLGRSHEREYLNGSGERVRWRLERVLTLDIVQSNDLEGAEVFSQRSDVSGGSPFDSVFDPEKHTPGQTGI